MTTINAFELSRLLEIANRAIEADDLERLARIEQSDLETAYEDFKEEAGLAYIEGNSPEWQQMMTATKAEYEAAQVAKRKAYNAKRRLKTAIDRHREASRRIAA